jgi:phage baseplate assembly protein W
MSEDRKFLGTDIRLLETPLGADISIGTTGDIELVSEDMNLAQAILHRLRTIKGELSDIGHPEYGSNIYDMVGEPNNETTRERIKMIVRNTLIQEPRIKEIVRIDVKPRKAGSMTGYNDEYDPTKWARIAKTEIAQVSASGSSSYSDLEGFSAYKSYDADSYLNTVDIDITTIPIESNVPLNIVFPFYLEGM